MKKRNDIKKFITEKLGIKDKFEVFQKESTIYYSRDDDEDGKCLLKIGFYGIDEIQEEIERRFKVKFPTNDPVLCICGEDKMFSGSYGCYEINLKCNSCGNEFSAYSG